ncbi:MAG: hypothetical protein C4345_00730 [Chloroflexota bacterium]
MSSLPTSPTNSVTHGGRVHVLLFIWSTHDVVVLRLVFRSSIPELISPKGILSGINPWAPHQPQERGFSFDPEFPRHR